MKTTTVQRLETKREDLAQQLARINSAIRAERKKMKEVAHRDAMAILHKSGVLDDPQRLRELIEKSTGQAEAAHAQKADHAQL